MKTKSKFVVLTEVFENSGLFTKTGSTKDQGESLRKIFSSSNGGYSLRKVLVNLDHIVAIREDPVFHKRLGEKSPWASDLEDRQGFTRIQMNCGTNFSSSKSNMVILGGYELIVSKIMEAANEQ